MCFCGLWQIPKCVNRHMIYSTSSCYYPLIESIFQNGTVYILAGRIMFCILLKCLQLPKILPNENVYNINESMNRSRVLRFLFIRIYTPLTKVSGIFGDHIVKHMKTLNFQTSVLPLFTNQTTKNFILL